MDRIAWGVVAILLGTGQVSASSGDAALFVPIGPPTSRPIGHVKFCEANPKECQPIANIVEEVALTDDLFTLLGDINRQLNEAIVAVTDAEFYDVDEYWAYPDGAGDCEDYALAKRRALAEEGWPVSTLLIAVVRQVSGAGHAVLTVRTDRGDLVLDNLDDDIHAWSETPYTYVKRQDPRDGAAWVSIEDFRDVAALRHH